MNASQMSTHAGRKECTRAHGLRPKENQYIYKHMPAAPPILKAPLRTSQPASPRACTNPTYSKPFLVDPPPCPSFVRALGTPRTLLSLAASGYQGRHSGQFGCHGLDELLLPKLRIENLEVLAGLLQQTLTVQQVGLHESSVLAHQVEQSAHLPLGLLKLPACLEGVDASARARNLTRACWIL